MCIDKALEMDEKTVESRIKARHCGDQRMMDMLKVVMVIIMDMVTIMDMVIFVMVMVVIVKIDVWLI